MPEAGGRRGVLAVDVGDFSRGLEAVGVQGRLAGDQAADPIERVAPQVLDVALDSVVRGLSDEDWPDEHEQGHPRRDAEV